jgi:hypothetical protein
VAHRPRAHRQPRPKKVFTTATSAAREGRARKARAMGAHSRWAARVRGRAGPSGWRSPSVRGSGEPSVASRGGRGVLR